MIYKHIPSQRLVGLDCLRGLLILWCIIYHISIDYGIVPDHENTDNYLYIIMSFFMCPFFYTSGYLFNCKRSFNQFIRRKFIALIFPYFVYTIWGFIVFESFHYVVFGKLQMINLKLLFYLGNLPINTSLWFLYSLFVCNVIYYILVKYTSKKSVIHVVMIFCFVIAYFTCNKQQILGYGNILLGLVYMHLGYMARQGEQSMKYVVPICLLVLPFLLFVFPSRLDFVSNYLIQGNYFANFLYSAVVCVLATYAFSRMKYQNILCIIGKYSIVFFACHRPLLKFVLEPLYLNVFNYAIIEPFFCIILNLICVVILCSLVAFAVLKTKLKGFGI